MRFGEFLGNEGVKRQLSAMIDAGRFPHALLLEGAPGSGKRMLAEQIARSAVCRATHDSDRPCGQCPACIKSAHPDISRLGDEGRPLTVDTVRELRQEAFVLPNEAAYRVMILEQAQNMTPQAQNALLKILEEPPAYVLFILTCEKRTQLLETIRSRCMCLTLEAVEWEEAAPLLQRRLPQLTPDQLQRAHSLFGGRLGQVIAGVTDGTLQQVLELTPALAAALMDARELPLLQLTGRLEKDKELTAGVLTGLQLVLRDALVLQYGGRAMLSTAPETAARLAGQCSGPRLAALLETAEALQLDLRRNMNNTLFITRMSACLRQAAGN